jgi:SNF2 family DNA or RNA helicase
VWKNQIILRDVGAPTDEAPWVHIGEHAKYSERLGAWHLAFSKQNLQRIYKQFGPIPVQEGQGRIESLKVELNKFNKMIETAMLAKTSPNLPQYDYRTAPIGPYQHRGVVYLVNVQRAALFASCGVGKTWMVAQAVEQLIKKGLLPRGKTLVCGKLATMYQGWMGDIQNLTNLKANVLWGASAHKRREKILKALEDPADLYLINHDGLRLMQKELAAKRFQFVICDESTVMKSYRSERSKGGSFVKALMHVAEHAPRRAIMSGTPAPNSPVDLWPQLHFLDPHGFLLEASWRDFKAEHTNTVYFGNPSDPNTLTSYVIKPESIEAIGNIINPLAYRIRIEDALPDLPELTVIKRMVDMSRPQAAHYAEMEETLHTEIDNEHIAVTIALAQIQKLRQITGGFMIDAEEAAHPIEGVNPKIEMLDQLLNEEIDRASKVIIYCEYRFEFRELEERYKDHGVVSYYGDTPTARKLANLEAFIKDPAIRIILLHPKSCAHGVTLTVAHYMVFYSMSHSSEDQYQAIHRIRRNSQRFPMIVYYLLAKDTIDEAMYDTVALKLHQQSVLIDPEFVGDNAMEVWGRLRDQVKGHKKKKKRGKCEEATKTI